MLCVPQELVFKDSVVNDIPALVLFGEGLTSLALLAHPEMLRKPPHGLIVLGDAAIDTVELHHTEAVIEQQARGLLADSPAPGRFFSDQDGELGCSMNRVDLLERDISQVTVVGFSQDGQDQLRGGSADSLNIGDGLLGAVGGWSLRAVSTHLGVAKPLRVGPCAVGLCKGS